MLQPLRTFFSHPLRLALTAGFFISFLTVAAAPFIQAEAPNCDVYAPNLMTECNCDIPDPNNKSVCLDDYYSSNGITLYDPNTPICDANNTSSRTTTSDAVGNNNKEKIFRFLLGKGLNAEQAAGVMGNLFEESSLDPAKEQGGRIVDENYTLIPGVGFGLAQWTYPSRQQNLTNYQRSSGRTIIDLTMQLEFLWKELSEDSSALNAVKATTTPEAAAISFHADFEKSKDNEAQIAERATSARKYYDELKALAPAASDSNPTSAGSVTCTKSATSGANGAGVDLMSNNFTIFNQCQYAPYGGPWGTTPTLGGRTACADACAPTALAMISKNLAGRDITPQDTIDYWTSRGLWNPSGGSLTTSPLAAAEAFGLKIEKVDNKGDLSAYQAVFDRGGAIMAISAGSSPFLPQRHAIVLRGITNGGSNFLIGDPGYKETNVAPLNEPSVDKILTDVRSDSYSVIYAFYK